MKTKNVKNKVLQLNGLIEELEERLDRGYSSANIYKINSERLENLYDYKEKITNEGFRRIEYEIDNENVRSRRKGERTEYHTSYGWFTDEQIKNLQNSRYFNE